MNLKLSGHNDWRKFLGMAIVAGVVFGSVAVFTMTVFRGVNATVRLLEVWNITRYGAADGVEKGRLENTMQTTLLQLRLIEDRWLVVGRSNSLREYRAVQDTYVTYIDRVVADRINAFEQMDGLRSDAAEVLRDGFHNWLTMAVEGAESVNCYAAEGDFNTPSGIVPELIEGRPEKSQEAAPTDCSTAVDHYGKFELALADEVVDERDMSISTIMEAERAYHRQAWTGSEFAELVDYSRNKLSTG